MWPLANAYKLDTQNPIFPFIRKSVTIFILIRYVSERMAWILDSAVN